METSKLDYNKVHELINEGKLNASSIDMSKFTESEKKHLMAHLNHQGHELAHLEMVLILIIAMALAQVALIAWKRKHYKSYQNVSMFCMWIVPFFIAIHNHWFRFVSIWLVITILTTAFIYKPLTQKNISGSAPRLIYKWFYFLYSFSSIITFAGYILEICFFLGLHVLLGIKPEIAIDIGFLLLFYGVYYGVLTRDFTDFLVDLLAANIGYYSPSSSLPSKQLNSSLCAICGRSHAGLPYRLNSDDDESSSESNEKIFELSCGHKYHEYCIYGWCLIGKKQICPFCKEKVDTNKLFASLPFQKPHYLYGNFLDFIRYLVAWQPLILFIVKIIIHFFGLE